MARSPAPHDPPAEGRKKSAVQGYYAQCDKTSSVQGAGGYQMVLVPVPQMVVHQVCMMPVETPHAVWTQSAPMACTWYDAQGLTDVRGLPVPWQGAPPTPPRPAPSSSGSQSARSEDNLTRPAFSSSRSRLASGSAPSDDSLDKEAVSSSMSRRMRRQRAAHRVEDRLKALQKAQEAQAQEAQAAPAPPSSAGVVSEGTAQELSRQLGAGEKTRAAAVAALAGSVWCFSADRVGCHVIQLALEVASSDEAKALVAELKGHVLEAVMSPYANHVLQRVIECLPVSMSSFVVEELSGSASAMAGHRYGCRIFCRLLEHYSAPSAAATALFEELQEDVEELICGKFAHHVAISMLEHGAPEHKHLIFQALSQRGAAPGGPDVGRRSGVLRSALHRNASYVTEKALEHCSEEDAVALAEGLVSRGSLMQLTSSPSGIHVMKALLRMPRMQLPVHAMVLTSIRQIEDTKFGAKLLQEIGLRGERPGSPAEGAP